MPRLVRTILTHRNDLFREGLRRILSETDFRTIKTAATPDDIRPTSLEKLKPDLLLTADLDSPSTALGIRRFKQICPAARVVALCDRCDLGDILLMLDAGADGIILTRTDLGKLAKSLHLVMLGETVLPSMAARLLAGLRESESGDRTGGTHGQGGNGSSDCMSRSLSDREEEILECLTHGEANKVIARRFDITEATVKVHIKAILRKVRVKNRTQAAIWAQRHLPQHRRSIPVDFAGRVPNGADDEAARVNGLHAAASGP